MASGKSKQVCVTVAYGDRADVLDRTFTSFLRNSFLDLHAFIVGDRLPEKQLPGITYHLRPPDPAFSLPLRDQMYRRWLFIDELDAEFALVIDNNDVLCLQDMPEIPTLLRGAGFGASVEHEGGRYIPGQCYISSYINCGVTFWHIPSTKQMRQEIYRRGRMHFRNIDDQRSINEVMQTRHYDQTIILPCQYNYRANLAPVRMRKWPTVDNLDGVVIYHNSGCIEAAKKLMPVKPKADLPDLPQDAGPLTPRQQFWRRLYYRFQPHVVGQRGRW